MASTPPLPVVLSGQIQYNSSVQTRAYNNPSSTLNNYSYEFLIILNVLPTPNIDQGPLAPGATSFDATSISVGNWIILNNR